jgi:hypothetical protein
MNDIEPAGGDYPSDKTLNKQGVTAITGLAGGAGLLVLGALPHVAGIALGVIIGVVGISALRSRDREDHVPGLIITIAGALSIFSRIGIIKPLAGTLLGLGAIGLLVIGVWSGIKFLKGLKSRR